MKKERSKEENKLKQGFQIALKGREGVGNFVWRNFDRSLLLSCCRYIRFSNHRLIKISIIYLYIKPEVKKKWYNSNDYSYKWSLYWVITWKLVFGEGDCAWSDYCNNFEKSIREIEFSFKAKNLSMHG